MKKSGSPLGYHKLGFIQRELATVRMYNACDVFLPERREKHLVTMVNTFPR